MTVVSNAGPLIALSRIGRLDILFELYSTIVVPNAVFAEVTHDPDMPGAAEIRQAQQISVVSVAQPAQVTRLLFWLDQGESEAIVLAQELGATLLIDERKARTISAALGIPLTGTVGVLLEAKRSGIVSQIQPLLDNMLLAGVRLSTRLYNNALKLAGESS